MSAPRTPRFSSCTLFPGFEEGQDVTPTSKENSPQEGQGASTPKEDSPRGVTPENKRRKLLCPVPVRASNLAKPAKSFCQEADPGNDYERFTVEGDSETTFLALGPRSVRSPGIVVLKRHGNVGDLTTNLKPTSHANLLNLKDAYLHEGSLYLVYEYGDISLDQVHPSVPLGEEHISIICREVSDWQNSCLKLFDWYRFCTASHIFTMSWVSVAKLAVRTSFSLTLTFTPLSELVDLSCFEETWLLIYFIGNIGKMLLHQKIPTDNAASVGKMMLEIMEPGTYFHGWLPIVKSTPSALHWSSKIIDFREKTKELSIRHLLAVS
jgi:hypothetical protein